MVEEFQGFGDCVSDGSALTVIVDPQRLAELLQIAVRRQLTAGVGPVTLEEAFLRVVGRSINAE
ncbi:MAG: hypothetical protein ACYCPV_02065 [Thermoplasmata archaeon]